MDDIVRRVKVDRSRTPQEALDATGCRQYVDYDVVNTMPRGEGDEVEVVFFSPEPWEYTSPSYMNDDDFEKALVRRCLGKDPIAIIKANEDDLALADTHPHGAHWKDADGNWCYAMLGRWRGERGVYVDRRDGRDGRGWHGLDRFAGSRKIGS